MNDFISKINENKFNLILCLLISLSITKALGAEHRNYILTISILFLALIIMSSLPLLKKFLISPLLIISTLYLPIGYYYGSPSMPLFASFFESNPEEINEFIKNFPLNFTPFFIFNLLLVFIYIKTKFKKITNSKILILLSFILLTQSPFKNFFENSKHGIISYHNQRIELSKSIKSVDLKITKINNKKKNYVVVIGESQRRDYMSLYNYSLNTTPFLNNANGIFINGYKSTAPNTISSLTRTLSLSNGLTYKPEENIVAFANQAGMETYWISNQGKMGVWDTLISKFAMQSKHTDFLKSGDFAHSFNYHDSDLLPLFGKALSDKKNKSKLIVLHLMGSHPKFCERIKKDYFNLSDKDLSCYLSSYVEFDSLMKEIVVKLNRSHEPYELIYFSDHGLGNVNHNGENIKMIHTTDKISSYDVPFFIMSDDISMHKVVNKNLSAYHFISIFLNIIGVESELVKSESINQVQEEEIKVYNFSKMIEVNKLKNDPAVEPI
ncbi:phosphoethanolamine transferase [Photobacterium leiognathi]|uniref:phosphoethanolamine transferase n=1 Tax=Photobacterium leiognathi TaxID=553611 RepID=UPI002982A160|nr:phosphoethanolamine transferase [Photobacterium leiognathi]